MSQHAELSGSTSHRWIRCPGSVFLIREHKRDNKPSKWGREGTFAHAVGAHILNGGSVKKYIEEDFLFEFDDHGELVSLPLTSDMLEHVNFYVQRVRTHADSRSFLIEKHVSLEFVREGMFGTLDAGILKSSDCLVVADFKYGYVPVYLINDDLLLDSTYGELGHVNSQLLYYAAGLAHEYGWKHEEVQLEIIQPRCPEVPSIQTTTVSTKALREWAENDLWAAAHAATTKDAPLNAGEWCRFCPVLDVCPAAREVIQTQAGIDFADIPETPVVPDRSEDLARILSWAPHIDAWLRACEAVALEFMIAGNKIRGQKLVHKRVHRRWPTEDLASLMILLREAGADIDSVKQLLAPPELMSPAQVERIFGKDVVKQVAIKPTPDLTIAPASSRAPSVKPDTKGDWDDL